MKQEFTPKLFTLLKEGISGEQIRKDVLSGLIVGIIALPLAIAFAIASGVSPDKGIITAIVAGGIISALGGSRVQIGGPTGAFIVIVYGIIQVHGVEGLTIATFMAGIIIILMGLARLGNLLKFIPYPLIVGFTSGIALIIFSSQIKAIFGLDTGSLPADFIDKWVVYFESFGSINMYALAIALVTMLLILGFQRATNKIPGSIIAVLTTTAAVHFLELPVETIESQFGAIQATFPKPHLAIPDRSTIQALIQPAIAIALLGAIESLLSAVVADGMIGGKHRSNMELVAQGTANIASALFGGIPATGAIARTATNVKNGGRTPLAGIVHAAVLLMVMLFLAPYAKLIPMACLAGILVIVAYNMSEWRQFRALLKGDRMDILILITTFFLTVFFDLVLAIEVGLVLSSFLFMKRMSESLEIKSSDLALDENEMLFEDELPNLPEGIILFEINGPLFFGAVQQFHDTITATNARPKVVILRMRYVPIIDATAIHRLKEIIRQFQSENISLIISGASGKITASFEQHRLSEILDSQYICGHIQEALKQAKSILNDKA